MEEKKKKNGKGNLKKKRGNGRKIGGKEEKKGN